MQNLHHFVVKKIFKSSILPILLIELFLIILIFVFGFLQEQENEQLLQNTAAQSFEEVAIQVTQGMNAKIERVEKDATALKLIIESHFKDSHLYDDSNLSYKYKDGFFIRQNKGPSTVYTTNLNRLNNQDKKNLKILTMTEISLDAIMKQYIGVVDSAWVNIGSTYSLYYPKINVQEELSSSLDPTKQSYYYKANAEHNPEKKTIFIPLFQEPWALNVGQIGSVVSPIYTNGHMAGVVGVTLTAKNTKELSDISLPFGAYIIILGDKGHVLFSSNEEEFYKDFKINSFNALHKQNSNAPLTPFICSPDEESNYVFFQKMLKETGLSLILIAKKDNINAEINAVYFQTRKYGFISLLIIGFIHILLFLYIRKKTKKVSEVISKPIVQLAHISEMLFDEKKLDLEESNINEFDTLQGNLNKAHEKLLNQLYYDAQTHLPNLKKLHLEINENSTLILICVENYKLIQNIYGPKVSFEVLKKLIHMLETFPRSKMHLFRTYNDTFALLSHSKVHLQDELKYLYNRLTLEHIHLEEFDISLNYALSISFPCTKSELPLFSRADIALDEAKKQEHRKYLSFDENNNEKELFKQNQQWAKRLQSALHDNRLVPFFQPIYDIKKQKVHKFESLVRMVEGDEVISPYFFLGVAKQMGKLSDITLLMLRHVFELAQTYPDVQFSVNTSFEDFEEAGLISDIQRLVGEFGINTQNIIIEILETGKYKDENHVIKTIDELKAMGFKIAIDDFGAGNSNFAHLMLMKVDFIKIDGQFVKDICQDERSENITKTINAFAHMTGASSIAEFVADEKTYERIKEIGVDFAQGYHISEPKPASQIDAMLKL